MMEVNTRLKPRKGEVIVTLVNGPRHGVKALVNDSKETQGYYEQVYGDMGRHVYVHEYRRTTNREENKMFYCRTLWQESVNYVDMGDEATEAVKKDILEIENQLL